LQRRAWETIPGAVRLIFCLIPISFSRMKLLQGLE
jgi:hypothetical protein